MAYDPIRTLQTLGRDLSSIPLSRVRKNMTKSAFICINTQKSYRLNLGTGPINDAVSMAKCLKEYEFDIYFLTNPHCRNFLCYLDLFFRNTVGQLVVFYVGHGTTVPDVDSGEAGGALEAFVFDDGVVLDDDFATHIIENKAPDSQLVLITDVCYAGTVWDVQDGKVRGRQLPPGVLSVSAMLDARSAKQTRLSEVDEGAFTYHLTRFLGADPEVTPAQLAAKMKAVLREYSQTFVIGTTTPSLLTQPFFK
jgi:hypothetical protein